MGKTLDTAAVARFRRDGFYAPVPVASREEARRMRAHLETYENEHGGPAGQLEVSAHGLPPPKASTSADHITHASPATSLY